MRTFCRGCLHTVVVDGSLTRCRKYFPPTPSDLETQNASSTSTFKAEAESTATILPSAPTTEPGYEDAPDAKKQKREHLSSDAEVADVAAEVADTAEDVDAGGTGDSGVDLTARASKEHRPSDAEVADVAAEVADQAVGLEARTVEEAAG